MPVLAAMHFEFDPAVSPHAKAPAVTAAGASFMHKGAVGAGRQPSKLSRAGLVVAALAAIASCVSASAQQTPGDIGTSWQDRRPIGQIVFASLDKISATNLNGWSNGGPIDLGVGAFQEDILSQVNTAIQNTLRMHGQAVLVWDIEGCGKTILALPNQEYMGDPRFLDPKGSGLTVPTDFSPYVPPTSQLGQQGLEPAMNAIADQVFGQIRAAGLVPGVCIRAQKVYVNSNGDLDGSHGTYGSSQPNYDTTAHQLADLDAKLTYAYERWGCRIFYVDANAVADDTRLAEANQGNPSFAPAWVYTQLWQRHPDCLICPEEWYPGAFSCPNLGIDDPAHQYERVSARYTELRIPWMGPFVTSAELADVPTAFTLISVADGGGIPLTASQLDEPDVVYALQNNQCILLARAWMPDSSDVALVINLETAAGVNGF